MSELNPVKLYQAIRHALHTYFLPLAKIHELYTVDVNEIVADFLNLARTRMPEEPGANTPTPDVAISIVQDQQYRRLKSTIDMQLALRIYNTYR